MANIDVRIGEIEFDLLEGEKTVGQIARDNGFADFGAMGQWLVDQRQLQLWRDLQAKAREAGEKPVTVTKRTPPPPTPQAAPVRQDTPTPKEQPMDEQQEKQEDKPRTWADYVEAGLKSPKKRTVAKAQKVSDLIDDLRVTVDAEAEEVETLKKIKTLEEQLAAEKAKIKKPSTSKASSNGAEPKTSAGEIRKWAQEEGYEVADRGQISPDIRAAYDEAHS